MKYDECIPGKEFAKGVRLIIPTSSVLESFCTLCRLPFHLNNTHAHLNNTISAGKRSNTGVLKKNTKRNKRKRNGHRVNRVNNTL